MRILLIAAIVLAIIALVCAVSPTTVIGLGALGWFIASFMAFLLDIALGDHAVYSGRL